MAQGSVTWQLYSIYLFYLKRLPLCGDVGGHKHTVAHSLPRVAFRIVCTHHLSLAKLSLQDHDRFQVTSSERSSATPSGEQPDKSGA